MPIKTAAGLSANAGLRREGICTIDEVRARTQDIRPLKLLVLNLMPMKERTELQLLRLLGNTPLQLEVDFAHTATHAAAHADPDYLERNYLTFADVKERLYDALIITGAPVETLAFGEVDYWPEFQRYIAWAKTHAYATLTLCWAAQASLFERYGIEKKSLARKLSGIYEYPRTLRHHALLRGFDDRYRIPQSRHTECDAEGIRREPELEIVSESPLHGINLVCSQNHRDTYVFGHFEYDRGTLAWEYERDLKAGKNPDVPEDYFPGDNPGERPEFTWKSSANLFFRNWINLLYEETPFDLKELLSTEHPGIPSARVEDPE